MSEFQIKPATRQGVKALVGFYGKSGSGKTMSSLLFARGLAGPGRIGMIDTENGRGSIFADLIPGGYSVLNLDAPFSPTRYADAISELENHADVIVIDSMSHEWSGEGGVLDMQEQELDRMAGKDNWSKREACKMAAWIKPKMEHKKMIGKLLRCKVPLICCLRGEEKTRMLKEDGKNKVVTDEFSSPLFDPRFIFEMLVNFETINRNGKGGYVYVVKCTHPSIATLLPAESEQIGEKHGAAMAKWCASPGAPSAATTTIKTATAKTRDWMLDQLKDVQVKMQAYGIDKGIILPNQSLEEWPLEKVPMTVPALKELRVAIENHK